MNKFAPGTRRICTLLAASLTLVPAFYADAQQTISGSQTTPVTTAKGGDVTISSSGSITVTSGAAVTINSNNTVDNEGTITGNDGKGMTGILVTTGATGSITNDGSINITDSTLATTLPLTQGENRYGIQIAAPSAFVGSITNAAAGDITVRGNDSAGIYVNTGGVTGSITDAGTMGITGDRSFGILTNAGATITGGIAISNTITALGNGAGGLKLNGAVGGELDISSTIRSDGYFSGDVIVSRPTSFTGLTLANVQQSGSAVYVGGNVGGGILVDTGGEVLTFGSAPALAVSPGAGASSTIGVTAAGAAGISIVGSVTANGIFDNVVSTAMEIGGGGGSATVNGGIDISGKVDSTSYSANANGIVIGAGANVSSLTNSGTIQSVVNLGRDGTTGGLSTAILDYGGALSSITNTGTITALSANGQAVALDLRADSTLVTVTQSKSGTTTASSINGNILFGSNGGVLNLNAGTIAGSVSFGDSLNNALTINNGGVLGGGISQAAGGQLALDIVNGRLDETSITKLILKSLTIGSSGQIDFAVDPTTGKSGAAVVTGAVLFASGAKLGLTLDAQLTAPEVLTVIQTAGSTGALVGQPSLLLGEVPYFYNAQIVTDAAGGTIMVDLRDRSFAEAGVLGSESAYNAVFKDNYNDAGIRDAFNGAGTQQQFKRLFQQMLPSYSGGVFEVLAQGADTLARTESGNPIMQSGAHAGGWAQQFGFGAVDSTSSSPGYHGGGLGFAFGWEQPASAISNWGIAVAYMRASASDFDTGPNNQEIGTTYTAGVYWREIDGGLHTDASINAGVAELNSQRFFSGTDLTGGTVSRSADANWTGGVAQAHLGISYEEPIGGDFYVKPSISGDYFVLYQGSRNEHNGGSAFDLQVASNTDKQGSVTGGVAAGMQFGDRDFTWRPEVMVGYKQAFGGPDAVVAQFAGGSSFSLSPASQKGGPVAHIGIHGGNKYSDFAVEAGGEDRGDYRAFDGRVVARFQF